jgi:hypothetical protein
MGTQQQQTTWKKWKNIANTKLLHLVSCDTGNKKKNERGLGFTKYLQVEIIEMLFRLGLVFVTTPSSHTF